jgi:hypothetical protein
MTTGCGVLYFGYICRLVMIFCHKNVWITYCLVLWYIYKACPSESGTDKFIQKFI